MDGSGLFILRAREVKRVNDKGQAGKDARKERKIRLAEALSDRHICHIDQQITTVYIGGKESSPSTGKRHPRVHRKLFRYSTLCTVRMNRMNVYVITGGSSVTHNTSLRLRVRFHVHRNAPCRVNTRQMNIGRRFADPIRKLVPLVRIRAIWFICGSCLFASLRLIGRWKALKSCRSRAPTI